MQANSNRFSRRLAFMAFSPTGGPANTTRGNWYFGSALGTKFTSENWNRGAGIGTVTPLHPSRLSSSNLAPLQDGGGASFLRSFTGGGGCRYLRSSNGRRVWRTGQTTIGDGRASV